MAKVKHNNFMDTVDEVISDAKKMGIVHLYTEDEELTGRRVKIKGRDLYHFGTTGYLGLEQDVRLKKAAADAIWKYGTQFPLSKTYISHPLYKTLEEKLEQMYGYPVIITKNSTLGHIGVIPCIVRDEDGVILDHQVHWSVQSAAQILKTRAVPVEMIRHNNLVMLEDKIKELSTRCAKIWYMADGVYSMYGDCAPIPQLLDLCKKYPQLHLYFDDVHGMSWAGKNGTGYVMEQLGTLPENVILFGTLSKTFGASGAVMVTSNEKIHKQVKNFGGPLTFSAQLEPASAAAAVASANIHLSPEIYRLQAELSDRTRYFNSLLANTDLPLVEQNTCPVFYIGTGVPSTGYHFVNRLMDEGFYVNLGLYPAVPVKNTGVRVTISRHNEKEEMKALVDAMVYHYPKALEETHTTKNKVRAAFKMPHVKEEEKDKTLVIAPSLSMQHEKSIQNINKDEWNSLLGKQSAFDWEGLKFLEKVFSNRERPEHNIAFQYFMIRDEKAQPVLATFLTTSLWKDDILAPASVSMQLEEKRKNDPYYLTSKVISMGSLFTEGQHYFLDKKHPQWKEAFQTLLNMIEAMEDKDIAMTVLRDFEEDADINEFLHSQGFIKVSMPDSCVVHDLSWKDTEGYLASLSPRSRKHFKKDIQAYEKYFDVEYRTQVSEEELEIYYQLFENVRARNFDLNTFSFPKALFHEMSINPNWEFIVLNLKKEYAPEPGNNAPVAVMFCYKNMQHTYVPSFIGMDYRYIAEFQIYRQMLYQTIVRAQALGFKKIDFGFSASFEKKKVGAAIAPKVAYIQAKDNFSMELMGTMQK
jgi:7-keto-8-aminopelargonate synthetase-like enzyme